MPDAQPQPDQSLHLPSLVIKNFRGIDELTIPRLGRVTLLAGKNGVGKTTVLDAVRVWAASGNRSIVEDVLHSRGAVKVNLSLPDGERVEPDWGSLFEKRRIMEAIRISTSPASVSDTLELLAFTPVQEELSRLAKSPGGDHLIEILVSRLDDEGTTSQVSLASDPLDPRALTCNALGPDVATDEEIEHYWNDIALSPEEDRAVEAMNLIADMVVERVAVIDPGAGIEPNYRRRIMAKVTGHDHPLPLRSLGDGAVRIFAVALALAASTDGFLLIDEAENGIHHSIQPKFWNMVLQTAQRNNVQVIATTHSWDCVTGFAQAANELEDVEGLLVRLERVPAGLRVFTYDESRLNNIAENGIEVR